MAAHQSSMPLELEAVATALACDSTYDHYADPVVYAPPYLYGVLSGPEHLSAAFWCRKQFSKTYSMLLVLVQFEKWYEYEDGAYGVRKAQVLSTMEMIDHEVGCGLSFWPEKNVPLSYFAHWPSYAPIEDTEETTVVNPIRGSLGDGLCPVFYYHNGDWLYFIPD